MEILCVFDSWVTVDNVYSSTLQSARDISEAETIAMCKDLSQSEGSFVKLEPIRELWIHLPRMSWDWLCIIISTLSGFVCVRYPVFQSGNEHFPCHGQFHVLLKELIAPSSAQLSFNWILQNFSNVGLTRNFTTFLKTCYERTIIFWGEHFNVIQYFEIIRAIFFLSFRKVTQIFLIVDQSLKFQNCY